MLKYSLLILSFVLVVCSCQDIAYTPKPRAYPKIDFPERKQVVSFQNTDCDFTFEYPDYIQVEKDRTFLDSLPPHPCWFDLYVPEFDSRLHCSYLPVSKDKTYEELRSDAFDLANWHNKKANYINEVAIANQYGVKGIMFEFEGPVASPFQFFLTDSLEQHFLRGALYFNTRSRPDSLAPMLDFFREDIDQMIGTFRWE
jgi:gliding motility-associated lipoprotein GldD